MSRQYTQQETTAFLQAESSLRAAGLVVDAEIGSQNGGIVASYFDNNPDIAVTQESIKQAVFGPLKEKLQWLAEDEIAFRNIWATLTPLEQGNFNSWHRPQRLINNLANNLAVLKYLKAQRYTVDARTLLQASADRIPAQLEWEPNPRAVDPRQHTDGSAFAPKDESSRYRGGKKNHAYQEPGSKQEVTAQLDQSESRWREMSEALRGNSHSETAELAATHGRSWSETFKLRKAILNRNKPVINKMGVS